MLSSELGCWSVQSLEHWSAFRTFQYTHASTHEMNAGKFIDERRLSFWTVLPCTSSSKCRVRPPQPGQYSWTWAGAVEPGVLLQHCWSGQSKRRVIWPTVSMAWFDRHSWTTFSHTTKVFHSYRLTNTWKRRSPTIHLDDVMLHPVLYWYRWHGWSYGAELEYWTWKKYSGYARFCWNMGNSSLLGRYFKRTTNPLRRYSPSSQDLVTCWNRVN